MLVLMSHRHASAYHCVRRLPGSSRLPWRRMPQASLPVNRRSGRDPGGCAGDCGGWIPCRCSRGVMTGATYSTAPTGNKASQDTAFSGPPIALQWTGKPYYEGTTTFMSCRPAGSSRPKAALSLIFMPCPLYFGELPVRQIWDYPNVILLPVNPYLEGVAFSVPDGWLADVGAQEAALAPFGGDLQVPPRQVKAADVKSQAIGCLASENASRWTVENPPVGQTAKLFTVEERDGKNVLAISSGGFVPARTTLSMLLPGDGPANGSVPAKNKASYVSFLCKSEKPVQITFQSLATREDTRYVSGGLFRQPRAVAAGHSPDPAVRAEDLRQSGGHRVAGGLLFRREGHPAMDCRRPRGRNALFRRFWKSHRLAVSLQGGWRFAADPGDQGMQEHGMPTVLTIRLGRFSRQA